MPGTLPALSAAQIDSFITDGFVRIDNAFPGELADTGRAILWAATGCNREDKSTWTQPVVRLGHFSQPPFRDAANTPLLQSAYDQLVGKGRWMPPVGLGTFPVRFPLPQDTGDTGWHVDVSFDHHKPDFFDWRANVRSRDRALLMLFLFSDVGEDDAPTRIRVGSHLPIARMLEPAGEEGMTVREMVADNFATTIGLPEALATGAAGTVYLCHPFLLHAAQVHRGTQVKFMAQPPLLPREQLQLDRAQHDYSPVEQAIRTALGRN